MFGSESDFDEQSGLLRSGKRYKRNFGSYTLGQDTEYTLVSPADPMPDETPYVGNPPVTPQRRPIIPENPSQSESNPSPSIPVVGKSNPVSPASSDPEENPSARNPLVTLQRRPIILENPSQSESNPSPSIPVTGQSTPVSSPPPTTSPSPFPLDLKWPI